MQGKVHKYRTFPCEFFLICDKLRLFEVIANESSKMSFELAAQNLNNECQNKGLLLQFILTEFIHSYRRVLTLHQFKIDLENNPNQKIISSLKLTIAKLSGSTKIYMHRFLLNQEEGVLTRLKKYCASLSSDDIQNDPTILNMQKTVNQAFITSLQGYDTLQQIEKVDLSTENISLLVKILKKIILKMGQFSKHAALAMQQFSHDENVVFFMLSHKSELDNLYGPQFVFKLVHKMYPKGLKELSQFLVKKYKKRGFHHLIPSIKKKISELNNPYDS